MTEQEAKDIDKLRMLVSLDALSDPNAAVLTRICDGFVGKCAELACIRHKSEALMRLVDSSIRRRVCHQDGLCGKPACPQGYTCLERQMKEAVDDLRGCLKGSYVVS